MNDLIWQKVFYNNIPSYISLINEELANEFPLEPLSNHIKVQGGYSFKANEYMGEGVPVIRISDFQDEKIDLSSVKYYKEDKIFDKFQLIAGDIIIAMTGGTIGKLAIVQDGLGKLYLNQRVGKFSVLNKNEFEPEYIYWLARGIQDKVKKLGYGGAQPNVSNGQIEALQFSFPEKRVQLKIIEFLNALKENKLKANAYFNNTVEKKIKKYQSAGVKLFTVLEECANQQTYLQQLRQVILQEAVQGKLTKQNKNDEHASALLKRIKSEKQKLIAAGKLKKEKELPTINEEEIPFELPKGWVWCRLGSLVLSMNNGLYKPEAFYNINGIVSLRMYNIQNGSINFENSRRVFLTKEEKETYKLEKFDILINRVNSAELVGKAAIIPSYDEELVYESMNMRVRLIFKESIASYINLYLRTSCVKEYFTRNLKQAISQASINQTQVSNLLIPLPPLSEQQHIVAKVQQLMQITNHLEEQVEHSQTQAQQLLQAVLKEAFTSKGKVYEMNEEVMMAVEE